MWSWIFKYFTTISSTIFPPFRRKLRMCWDICKIAQITTKRNGLVAAVSKRLDNGTYFLFHTCLEVRNRRARGRPVIWQPTRTARRRDRFSLEGDSYWPHREQWWLRLGLTSDWVRSVINRPSFTATATAPRLDRCPLSQVTHCRLPTCEIRPLPDTRSILKLVKITNIDLQMGTLLKLEWGVFWQVGVGNIWSFINSNV